MAEVIKMPKLSDTMTEGVVAKWHKKVGDKVKNGEILADIETDKATMEFESFYDGVLLYIGVEVGKPVAIDSLLAIIGKEGEDIKSIIAANQSSGESKQEAVSEKKEGAVKENGSKKTIIPESEKKDTLELAKPEVPSTVNIIRMPKLSDTMTEGVVAKWHKKVGDKVKNGELLADIETDKATMEFESFFDGVLLYIGADAGKPAAIDSLLAIVGKGGEDVSKIVEYEKAVGGQKSAAGSKQEAVTETVSQKSEVVKHETSNTKQEAAVQHSNTNGRIKASPLAKKIAKDKGIDLNVVHGSGDFGRIIKKDIEFFSPSMGKSVQTFVGTEGFTDEPVSQMRKVIAKRLVESVVNAPHFYLTMEIDMDHCIASREAINKVQDVKVSYNDIVIRACAAALRKHPKVNGAWMGDKIRYYNHIHIGMAVAVEDGLLVPVIRFADGKSLPEIATEAKEFGKKAKEKKLQPKDWEGNTFTVSNLGMFGIDEFTSILNTPEACILAVGGIKQVPVVKNGAIVPGNIMKITLSCDHRVVDGATGAAFLQTLKLFLENPVTMFV
jgi:pyruvate dehydrogenase E2 component (dihydrolipoamide acetyltransferase)